MDRVQWYGSKRGGWLKTQSKVARSFLSQKHDFSKFLKSTFEYFQLHFITYPTNISHWLYKISFIETFLQFPILNTLFASCDFHRKHRKNHVKRKTRLQFGIFFLKKLNMVTQILSIGTLPCFYFFHFQCSGSLVCFFFDKIYSFFSILTLSNIFSDYSTKNSIQEKFLTLFQRL